MGKQKLELAVGAFIVVGIGALVMLALQVSNLASIASDDGYEIHARFDNIGGLKVRAPVMMSGVRVGQVTGLGLDGKTFEAVITLNISEQFNNLPKDTSASIFTSGLLGEQYIALEPGGDEKTLQSGDTVTLTQSAIVLEQVIGQVLFDKASGE